MCTKVCCGSREGMLCVLSEGGLAWLSTSHAPKSHSRLAQGTSARPTGAYVDLPEMTAGPNAYIFARAVR
jgi:hypothetical protein